jgi:hypothetical protein
MSGAINTNPNLNLYATPRPRQAPTKHWQDISQTFGSIRGLRSQNNLIKMRLREREIIVPQAGSDTVPQSILIAHNH